MSDHSATADSKHTHGAESHGEGHEHHGSLLQHAKPYIAVGVLLFIFTCITVGLSYIDFAKSESLRWIFAKIGVHGGGINILIGMIVATFKVCLVGWWFMHLKQEKAGIWRPLLFTFFFVAGLMLLCMLAYHDPIPTTSHFHK